ncbi:helix-turn-helix transcriptional regulator [Myceligenerans pegani]|uniref:Helix-turn-helix domain-containing protein n=1 Tax=Myceligenerans pegani TaxID=2776917 RepID=A0ABR9N0T9_9MICO|nr:helix-turn-helix transcriptional regulator [Myceligenerans sp. TRM 65318]MBE1876955.1 helix-turn-helix domain-containing protein [Myceligenerans sp. TRM 65318]MBE3019226.1 helix-turn-helix domain-containing protein [Myceligenerans sp. TRM 65318]
MTDRNALASFVRRRRERLRPADVGLPAGADRRTPGLRRDELAALAGVSADYVTRIEQARGSGPSAQVVAALAQALRLTDDERDHLYRLASLLPPTDREVDDDLPPGLRRVLDSLSDLTPAAVFAADWQLIWWNHTWAGLIGDPAGAPAALRNFARVTFPPDGGGPLGPRWTATSADRDALEAAMVSDLRRASGRYPESERLHDLIRELTETNERFAELWASGSVGVHRADRKTIHHRTAGPIAVDCDVITDGDGDRKLVVMSAQPGSEDEAKLRLAVAHSAAPSRPSLEPARSTAAPTASD